MAGYVSKKVAAVYEGTHKAAEELTNGVFVEITADGIKKITATKDQVFRVDTKTTLWGLKALDLMCVSAGANEVYFVECEWEINDNEEYDEKLYTTAIGKYVKMKRMLPGEHCIMSVSDAVYAALAEGDSANPASGGLVAKVSG